VIVQPRSKLESLREGVVASLPLFPGIAPVGALFGAIAVAGGLTKADAVLMSAIVYAGASQFVAIDLYGQGVPAWPIVLSVFAVNFRHVLYSAALTPVFRRLRRSTRAAFLPLLIDPVFAYVEKRLEDGRGFDPFTYLAMGLTFYVMWVASSAVGAFFGALVEDPEALALDMLLPLYFLTLVLGFRARPNWSVTVIVAGVVSALVYHAPAAGLTMLGSPWHITAGAAAGILAAVLLARGGESVSIERAAGEETFEPASGEHER